MKFKQQYFFCIFFVFIFLAQAHGQKKIDKEKNKILAEGLALYTLILANWTSNDLYYENEFNTSSIKGYLSYRDKDTIKTIFWRETDTTTAEYKAKTFKQVGDTGIIAQNHPQKAEDLRVITKTFSYSKINVTKKNAEIIDYERAPSETEKMLMDFRAITYKAIITDTAFFKQYAGTQLKAVPFDAGKQVKVYVYSSVMKDGIVPIGGDYLLVYDKKENVLLDRMDLHQECIFISGHYKGKASDASKATLHKHKEGAAELITPTDIATLLLYKSQLEWDEHHVVAGKYTCVFTFVDRKLDIISTSEFEYLKNKKIKNENEEKKSNMH